MANKFYTIILGDDSKLTINLDYVSSLSESPDGKFELYMVGDGSIHYNLTYRQGKLLSERLR